MRKGVYEIVGFIFLTIFLFVAIIVILDGNFTGRAVLDANETSGNVSDGNETSPGGILEAGVIKDLPWLWILIGIGVFALVVIILVVLLVVIRRNSSHVIMVSRPSDSSFDESTGVAHKKPSNGSTSLPFPDKKAEVVKPDSVGKKSKSPPAIIKKVVSLVKKEKKPAPVVHAAPVQKKTVRRSRSLLPARIRYIKYYAHNISHDPKVRIKYLIKSGKKFVKNKNYSNAKEIYRLVFEAYKGLEVHDEGLYVKIVAFRKSIRG